MKKEVKKSNTILNKNSIILIAIIVLIAIVVALIIVNPFKIGGSKKNTALKDITTDMEKIGSKYYDSIYYPYVQNPEELLSRFTENGINIAIKDIQPIIEFDEKLEKALDKHKCDLEKSKIYIYPKAPYGASDYTVKVEMDCKK